MKKYVITLIVIFLLFPLKSLGFTSSEVVIMINNDRTAYNIAPLEVTDSLNKQALARARYLYEHNQWSHAGWRDGFASTTYTLYGENLAKDFYTTSTLNDAWLNSPTHRANLLKPTYKCTGVGVYKNYVVQLFGGFY